MARKTVSEIEAEIASLKALLPDMPNYKDGINVSIRVLESQMTNDDVYDAFEGSDLFDDAHSTLLWRDGQSRGDAPSALYLEMR